MQIHMWITLSLIVLGLLLCTVDGNILLRDTAVTEASHADVLQKWISMDKAMKDGVENMLQTALPVMMRLLSDVELSTECTASFLEMVLGLKELRGWPLMMIDASGKIPSGLFSGRFASLGNYDQCVNIADYEKVTKRLKMQGKYCTVNIRPPLPAMSDNIFSNAMPPFDNLTVDNLLIDMLKKGAPTFYFFSIRFGICIPSTCSGEEINNMLSSAIKDVNLYVSVDNCEVKETLKIDKVQYCVIGFLSFLILLCISGTVIDATSRENNLQKPSNCILREVVTAFSIPRNARKVLHVGDTNSKLGFVHGIRFIAMIWVILAHSFVLINFQTFENGLQYHEWMQTMRFQFIFHSVIAVDIFFFLSGFLLSYISIKQVDEKGKHVFNVVQIMFHRFWRLLPTTMITVAIILLTPMIGSGPVWHETTDLVSSVCRQYWWTNVLSINNFVPFEQMCLPHTWYLAADTQVYIICVFVLFIFVRKNGIGLALNAMIIVASMAITGIIHYVKKLPATLIADNPNPKLLQNFAQLSHFKPQTHIGPCLIGLWLGIYLCRKEKTEVHPALRVLLWIVTAFLNFGILFAPHIWISTNSLPDLAMTIFYAATNKTVFCIGFAWLFFACFNGYAGFVSKMLSWPGFVPLSRLTFTAYLWHFPMIVIYMGCQKTGLYIYELNQAFMYLSFVVVSFGLAFAAHLLYDGPFAQLEKIILKAISNKKPSESQEKLTTFQNAKTTERELPEIIETQGKYTQHL